jgi:hypothetical protein
LTNGTLFLHLSPAPFCLALVLVVLVIAAENAIKAVPSSPLVFTIDDFLSNLLPSSVFLLCVLPMAIT